MKIVKEVMKSAEMRCLPRSEIVGNVSENVAAPLATPWLTMPDLVEALDVPLGRVRRLIDEHYLIGSRRNGAFAVPAAFIVDGQPLSSLRGTVIVLKDAGFGDDELIDWLFEEEESLGRSPIAALLDGHKSAVRRLARTLA